MLYYYEADGDSFELGIITGDETWIHHLELQTERVAGMASFKFDSEEKV